MERRVLQEFIEIYHSEPSLWKVKSCHYNNKSIKNVAYRRLLAKLRELYPEADVELVKRKINALRTNFRKELRKVEASRERSRHTGEPVYVPSLWYFELFHFIADQEQDQAGKQLDDNDLDGNIDVQDMLRVDLDENVYFEGDESDENFEEEFQVSSPDSPKPPESQPSLSIEGRRMPDQGFKRKRYLPDEEWYQARSDGHDIFGRYVAHKLRGMDRGMRALAERIIAETLFRGQSGLLSRGTTLHDPSQLKREEDPGGSYS